MGRVALMCLLCAVCFCTANASSHEKFAEPDDQSSSYRPVVLLSGLDNPTGITLRPGQAKTGDYEIYLAESGAGRVLRLSTREPEKTEELIAGFSTGTLGQTPKFRVGPLALGFITRTKLAVARKGGADEADQIACYSVRPGSASIAAEQQDHLVGPLDQTLNPQSEDLNFCGLAIIDNHCFVASANQGSKGRIFKSTIEANRLTYLEPFIDVQDTIGISMPAGIAVIPAPRPAFLVAGLMGSTQTPQDSRLAYFVPSTGELALDLPTGLNDIISLAYSPSGQLYAADFSWHDEQAGGVYRLDDARLEGQQTCRAVKIASLVRPYGLAFAPDGSLFVTTFGSGENEKQGTLVRIKGGL